MSASEMAISPNSGSTPSSPLSAASASAMWARIASSSVAALPSCRYGSVRERFRSGGVLKSPAPAPWSA